ncbi:hypothetical protein BGX34_005983 [Mortierella sp. NVP85]|nr:hypothetical protein BGX34_005983 [Mortierella sp. NVP85]
MFGIPELDNMLCSLLTRHDLAQCARVNTKWYTAIVPSLWRDLSCLNGSSNTQQQAFRTLVYEDYLHEKQQDELHGGKHGTEEPTQARPQFLATLTRYIPWIGLLPDLDNLFTPHNSIQQQGLLSESSKSLAEKVLLLHLVNRCRHARLSHFCLYYDSYGSDFDQEIMSFVLPRVRHLSVQAKYHDEFGGIRKLHHLLNQCSTTLMKLTLNIDFQYTNEWNIKALAEQDFSDVEGAATPEEWLHLKELVLNLWGCFGALQPSKFWSWLFQRCGRVETLKVSNIRPGPEVFIAEAALANMPNLVHITLGQDVMHDRIGYLIEDHQVATLLRGSRRGWKSVRLKNLTRFKSLSMEALGRDFATLEAFEVAEIAGAYDSPTDLLRVLSSCPNLRAFSRSQEDPYFHNCFASSLFVDCDPNTYLLKTWACESSLKVLKASIGYIPRPELGVQSSSIYEAYPGQGREIQGLVYDRIARLTNLEVLGLGLRSFPRDHIQYYCLEMSLESGLHKLSRLKKLQALSVVGMVVRIGVKEAQWMVEHWPRLRIIDGLDERSDAGKEAVEWLKEHYPGSHCRV